MQLNPDKTPNSIFADIQQRKIGENAFNSSGLRWIKDVVLGKRNDSSFRTVVVGDPDLELSEVGIPCHIAESLQVSEYVNRQNREKLLYCCELRLLELPSGKELMSTHLFRSGHGAVFWLIIVNANIYV